MPVPTKTTSGAQNRLTTAVRMAYNADMHLSDYMTLHKLDDDAVALGIERTRVTVSRIRRRKVRPDWNTIEEIKRFTNGAVVADDFQTLESAQ
jgi:hypothetical protein